MKDEELIAKAVEHVGRFERLFGDKRPEMLKDVTVETLPRKRVGPVREVVHVFFEGDDQGHIDVSLDYQTGECLGVKFVPPKEQTTKASPNTGGAPNRSPAAGSR